MSIRILIIIFILSSFTLALEFEIKENNKLKTMYLQPTQTGFMVDDNFIFNNNNNLQIKFNQVTPELVKMFELKYNLELKEVMVIGIYIYKHNSDDIATLIEDILTEDNIKTIKPLWTSTKAMLY
jgi:hypothetical protein